MDATIQRLVSDFGLKPFRQLPVFTNSEGIAEARKRFEKTVRICFHPDKHLGQEKNASAISAKCLDYIRSDKFVQSWYDFKKTELKRPVEQLVANEAPEEKPKKKRKESSVYSIIQEAMMREEEEKQRKRRVLAEKKKHWGIYHKLKGHTLEVKWDDGDTWEAVLEEDQGGLVLVYRNGTKESIFLTSMDSGKSGIDADDLIKFSVQGTKKKVSLEQFQSNLNRDEALDMFRSIIESHINFELGKPLNIAMQEKFKGSDRSYRSILQDHMENMGVDVSPCEETWVKFQKKFRTFISNVSRDPSRFKSTKST